MLNHHADKFPSSEAFQAINDALNSSDADRKDAIKQGNAVFAFTLKNKAGDTESWHIDLKETGKVATGTGNKPTGTQEPSLFFPHANLTGMNGQRGSDGRRR